MRSATPASLGERRVLAPGELIEITRSHSDLRQRNSEWHAFLTEPGVVRIRARYETWCGNSTVDAVVAVSDWVQTGATSGTRSFAETGGS